MRRMRALAGFALMLAVAAVPASAQEPTDRPIPRPQVEIDAPPAAETPADAPAATERATRLVTPDQAARAEIGRALNQDAVRDAAAAMGIDLDEARREVAGLNGPVLHRLAERAEDVNAAIQEDSITFEVTTLILILLAAIVVILLAQ